jgi:seryl-tRNA synthetase
MLRQVGNLVFDDVPVGGEDDYVVLETLGTPRTSRLRASGPKII